MGIHISNLNNEWTDSIIIGISIILDEKSSEDECMVGISSHLSGPPLGCGISWGVDHKLVSLLVEGGGGLEASDVRAMADFGLSIASDDVQVGGGGEPLFTLLVGSELVDGLGKHGCVETNWWLTLMMENPVILWFGSLLEVELSINFPGSVEFLHPICLDLLWGPFVVFMGVVHDRIFSHMLLDLLSIGSDLWVLVENVV